MMTRCMTAGGLRVLMLGLLACAAGLLGGCARGVQAYAFPGVSETELVESFRRVSGATAGKFSATHFGGPAWTEAAVNPELGEAGVSLRRHYHDVSLIMMPIDRAEGSFRLPAEQQPPEGAAMVFSAHWQHWFGVVGQSRALIDAWVAAMAKDLDVAPVPMQANVDRRIVRGRFGSEGLEFASNRGQMDGPDMGEADDWLTRWTKVGREGTARSLELWEYE